MALTKRIAGIFAAIALTAPLAAAADDAPGTFKIPGTDTTLKLYGYVQLDATVDFGPRIGDIEGNDWATFLPAVPRDGSGVDQHKKPQVYLTARTSRFGIQTGTPTKLGNVGVRLEADFNGPNPDQSETFTNSTVFRLRHAYGTVGGLLIGQTWSTFLDLNAAPDTVDFNGPGTLALVRNPMVRYAYQAQNGLGIALAVENARGAQFGGSKFQSLPDFHANVGYSGKWGTVSLRGVTQYYRIDLGNADPASKFSVAGAISGSFKLAGDTIVAQFAGGPGIGRYMLNAAGVTANLDPNDPSNLGGNPGAFLLVNNALVLPTVYGGHLGYTHVWNPEFRSNLIGAATFVDDPNYNALNAGIIEKQMLQGFANTFWTFAKNAELGVEFAYGEWKSFGPEVKGHQYRVNTSFHYNFF